MTYDTVQMQLTSDGRTVLLAVPTIAEFSREVIEGDDAVSVEDRIVTITAANAVASYYLGDGRDRTVKAHLLDVKFRCGLPLLGGGSCSLEPHGADEHPCGGRI